MMITNYETERINFKNLNLVHSYKGRDSNQRNIHIRFLLCKWFEKFLLKFDIRQRLVVWGEVCKSYKEIENWFHHNMWYHDNSDTDCSQPHINRIHQRGMKQGLIKYNSTDVSDLGDKTDPIENIIIRKDWEHGWHGYNFESPSLDKHMSHTSLRDNPGCQSSYSYIQIIISSPVSAVLQWILHTAD